jgi:hypothetical protein
METGMPDLSRYMIPNRKKCTKLTQNLPNGHKISPMSVNIRNVYELFQHFSYEALKKLPKLEFLV